MSKARDSVVFLNSPDDREVWRAKRAVIGYDDDPDITNNTTALEQNQALYRYSTDYSYNATINSVQIQRYISADVGGRGNGLLVRTNLGQQPGGSPVEGYYRPEWGIGVEFDNYSTDTDHTVSVGMSSVIRRYSDQGVMAIHCNAMDMRIPQSAADPNMGGITGMEAHSDGIGPDHRTSGGTNYGYRQTIRCTARTETSMPDWVKRGTGVFGNGHAVAVDAICVASNATLTEEYLDPYFVCVTAGTLGGTATVLDATTTTLTQVTDGTVVWECRIGAEVGVALRITNGVDNGSGQERPGYYRYGIIVDHQEGATSALNEIAHAVFVNNSGEVNFESYGDPDYHARFLGEAAPADVGIGAELNAGTVGGLSFLGWNGNDVVKTYAGLSAAVVDNTVASEDGRLVLSATVAGAGTPHAYLEGLNTVIGLKNILDTTATAGFLHIGRCAGPPTGVPDLYTGKCPMVVDSTNGRLYVYHTGAWHYAALT